MKASRCVTFSGGMGRLVVRDVIVALVCGMWPDRYGFNRDWLGWDSTTKPVWVIALLPCDKCEDSARNWRLAVRGLHGSCIAIESGHGMRRGIDEHGNGVPREGIEW